ncbi:nucleotidyl transferase AbiEii/AbiGii toxin family protein [Wenzhouxiangella sp. EGI_FJ10305]|uniref:nucleotidyl transferase AbiEii/AbiGii toxin family protein n=1 Tax=Wenzhouxiangella sp. EGI_FJ10305 TaxID=3243768 RepID=UPI0035DD17DE
MAKETFDAQVEQAMAAGEYAHMRPVIEKELLHYDILHSLDRHRLLDRLVFQGGTCLRLIHGAPRFSEDLDFVGGSDFATDELQSLRECIERDIGSRYGLEVTVKPPKAVKADAGERGIRVDKWQISIITAPERPDIPRQRIKVEVAAIPAWTRETHALRRNYDFLPDGYEDILVPTESLDEIMADKLVSLVNCRRFVRHRDIWDLRWLMQKGAQPDRALIEHKIEDYHVEHWPEWAGEMRRQLPEIIHGEDFRNTLTRFIPVDVQARTLDREGFLEHLLRSTDQLLQRAMHLIEGQGAESDEDYRI